MLYHVNRMLLVGVRSEGVIKMLYLDIRQGAVLFGPEGILMSSLATC